MKHVTDSSKLAGLFIAKYKSHFSTTKLITPSISYDEFDCLFMKYVEQIFSELNLTKSYKVE